MKNETHSSRFRLGSKAASIVLTAAMTASSFTGLGAVLASPTVVEAANSYGLASKIEDGNILHCFDWSLAQITEELPNIAKAGFTSVQTSPVQPHDASGTWYWLYQPTGFSVGNDNGSKEDLQTLCSEADKYGIKVIVDVVANHVAGWADGRRKDYIQNGLTSDEYFHNTQYNTDANNVDWGNRWQVTHCNIGMPDLNSEHQYVQQVVAGLVNELKACGVDGIRWDAAKHIGLPSEDCNFWPAVTAAGLYNYGEILDGPINKGGDDKMVEYTKYIGVTDDNYCGEITGAIRDGHTNLESGTGKWANRGVAANKLVYWPESHDTYCNNGWTNGLSEDIMDRAFAVSGARADCQTLYLSRPFEKQHTAIAYGVKGSTHFTSAQVAAVNHFHNAMVGTKEYFTTAENCFVICRGGGAVVVNAGGGGKSVTVPNGGGLVPAGTYTDEITGSTWTVTSSTMSGQIGNTGIAVFYNGGSQPDPDGSVSASPATGTSFTDTLSVTLSASDATGLTYSTSEGASGSFTNGQKITVGSSTAVGGTVTVTVKGTGASGKALSETYKYTKKDPNATTCIYFDNSSYNWSSVYAYVYDESSSTAKSMAAWPGVKMTEKNSAGYFKLDVSGYEANGQVIFNDGTGSATNRYPADMQPGLKIGGSSKLFSAGNKWADYTEQVVTKDPAVTVDKASGTSFTTETFDITLSLSNATKGTYSVDDGPEKTFTSATKVTIGEGKIGDSDVTVKATATDGTNTKSYTFTYKKKYTVKTSSTSASALTGKYATNPKGQLGGKGVTIKSASDFKDSMIIAQGVANDDPRIFRGSHEAPVYDTYALYAAWDDTNLYLGWQFTNVTDVVDPAQGFPISDNGKPWNGNIPQMLAFDLGKGKSADMTKGTLADGYVWGLKVGFETRIDALMCFSSKPKVGEPALFQTDSTGYFNYKQNATGFVEGGISFTYEDGFFGSSITGINANGYGGYKPADLTSASSTWVDFLTLGHDKAQDTFYTMTIPLATLGITRSYLENTGIGVMHISTFGEGGITSIPLDMTFLDNATEPYVADESTSQEKADTDLVTVPLARIGAGGGDNPIDPDDPDDPDDPTTPLQVNFGTDRSAPQLSTTAMTIKGIGYGGTAPYKYEFSVDGKVVKASNTTATVSWTPTTAGQHTLKCVITDSTGATATATKTFTSEGGGDIIIVPDLVNNSKVSATTISLGSTITATAAASGGTSPYTYQIVYKKSTQSSWTTASAYSTTKTATIKPASSGAYQICIKVKDSNGTEVKKFFDITVNAANTLTNNSKVSATTINQGDTITATAAATGGTTPYTYQIVYKKSTQSSWTTASAYSTTKTATIKPASSGAYQICIKVKDKTGTEVKKFFDITVKASALTNNSTVSATSVALGTAVTVKGAATGGTTPYKYAFFYKASSSSTWTTKQDFSATSSVSIKFTGTGTKDICVKVKDNSGTVVKKYFTVTVKAALVNNSTLSATSIKLGSTVTAKGAATGGSGYYNFAVLYKQTSQTKWTTAQAYKSNTTVSFKPAAATTYDVCIKVKDSAGTEVKKYFTLKVTSAAALANTSTVSATSIALGNTVTVKGAATGGTAPYKYAVYYKASSASTWSTKQDFSTTNSTSIKFTGTGTKDICVKVKDNSGTVAKKYFTVKVTSAALTNNSTVSATSIKLGSTVTVKGAATGGTAPYKYAVYYKASSASTWNTKQDFSATNSTSIKFTGTGTKDICVKVKDNAGTVAKKYFTVTVKA